MIVSFLWWKLSKCWLKLVCKILLVSILHYQHWRLLILWWLSWKTPLTAQWLALAHDDFAQAKCSHNCRTKYWVLVCQPLSPNSFHSLIKLLQVRCTLNDFMYSALDNTTLVLSWDAAPLTHYTSIICWFLIPIGVNQLTLGQIHVQIQEEQNSL